MKHNDEIMHAIESILVKYFDVKPGKVHEYSRISEDLGIDSLDYAEFIVILETEFKIILPDRVVDSFREIGELTDYLEKHFPNLKSETSR